MSEMGKFNTIYIVSKGRPNCLTANTLISIDYPGEWFIVCGDNDETIPEYIERYGEDRIMVFNFQEAFDDCDMLDNLELTIPSGAVPAHNQVQKISRDRGELRHWQLDDDITSFYIKHPIKRNNLKLNGDVLYKYFTKIAEYGYKANLSNVGFSTPVEGRPETMYLKGTRVYNMHNFPSEDDKYIKLRGRLCEDIIQPIDSLRNGRYSLAFRFLTFNMPVTESLNGGNTDLYNKQGLERKAGYGVMVSPIGVKLSYNYDRLHHYINWNVIKPMVLDEKWKKD